MVMMGSGFGHQRLGLDLKTFKMKQGTMQLDRDKALARAEHNCPTRSSGGIVIMSYNWWTEHDCTYCKEMQLMDSRLVEFERGHLGIAHNDVLSVPATVNMIQNVVGMMQIKADAEEMFVAANTKTDDIIKLMGSLSRRVEELEKKVKEHQKIGDFCPHTTV